MIGVLLITHGKLGNALLDSANIIYGCVDNAGAIALEPQDDVNELIKTAKLSIQDLDDGDGVIVLVDMAGGSCATALLVVANQLSDAQLAVVAGVNLPMLVQVLCRREQMPLLDLMAKVLDSGRQNIVRLFPSIAQSRGKGS